MKTRSLCLIAGALRLAPLQPPTKNIAVFIDCHDLFTREWVWGRCPETVMADLYILCIFIAIVRQLCFLFSGLLGFFSVFKDILLYLYNQ
jgi:hypothetical protein